MIAAFSMSEDNNAQQNSLGEEFVVGSQSPERNSLSRSILNYASPSPESNLSELTNSTSNSPSHSAAVELSPSDEEKINCELSLLRESDVNKPNVKSFHGILDGSKVELQLQDLSFKLKEDLTCIHNPTAMRYPFPIQNPSHILSPSPRLPSIDQLTSAINTRGLGTIPRSASAPPSVVIGAQESFNADIEDDFLEVRGRYKVLEKIGEGTFSSVYKAVSCDTTEIVALKRIYSTCRPARILNEIQHLKTLGGKCYVPELLGGLRFQDQVTLVIPYFEHDKFKDYLVTMNLTQIRQYMKALFEALQHLHTNGVIHRDIKPGNFLYDVKNNRYMLVDFGLAQSQHELLPQAPGFPPSSSTSILRTSSVPTMSSSPSMLPATATTPTSTRRKRTVPSAANEEIPPKVEKKQKRTASSPEASVPTPTFTLNTVSPQSLINSILQNGMKKQMQAPRAGTRGFRAPEVLLKYPYQTTAIDIWSAGIILLCILSMRYPFFNSPDDLVALAEIGALCGTKEVTAAALALGRKVDFPVCIPKINIKDICIKLCGPRPYALPDSAYDLLSRCLELNPYTRISAEDALQHPFFTETN